MTFVKRTMLRLKKKAQLFFALPVKHAQTQSVQADQSVRIEFIVTKEVFAKIQQAQELLSHSVPTRDLACLLEYLADKVTHQKTGLTTKSHRAQYVS